MPGRRMLGEPVLLDDFKEAVHWLNRNRDLLALKYTQKKFDVLIKFIMQFYLDGDWEDFWTKGTERRSLTRESSLIERFSGEKGSTRTVANSLKPVRDALEMASYNLRLTPHRIYLATSSSEDSSQENNKASSSQESVKDSSQKKKGKPLYCKFIYKEYETFPPPDHDVKAFVLITLGGGSDVLPAADREVVASVREDLLLLGARSMTDEAGVVFEHLAIGNRDELRPGLDALFIRRRLDSADTVALLWDRRIHGIDQVELIEYKSIIEKWFPDCHVVCAFAGLLNRPTEDSDNLVLDDREFGAALGRVVRESGASRIAGIHPDTKEPGKTPRLGPAQARRLLRSDRVRPGHGGHPESDPRFDR